MEITDVRIFLREKSSNSRLKAYATITMDHVFVVRNLKVIEGTKGLFVAMPSERSKEPCPKCGFRNVVRSHFCNQCGSALHPVSQTTASAGDEETVSSAEHRDVAHPITPECREALQQKVMEAYEQAKKTQIQQQ